MGRTLTWIVVTVALLFAVRLLLLWAQWDIEQRF
jgi:hypothetical protein